MDLHTWITDRVDAHYALAKAAENDLWEVAQEGQGSAASTLRRCEADRRILVRHNVWTGSDYCDGCGPDLTTRIDDCPELLDLAHAHGITEQELAGLDRPQAPERKPRTGRRPFTMPITTSDVPAALRGPGWQPRT